MKKGLVPKKGFHGLKNFNPNEMFEEFQNHVNNFFNDFMTGSSFSLERKNTSFNPKFDVVESDESYEVKAELPGMTEKDIDVSIDGSTLTIKGEKETEKEEEKKNYYVSERAFGKFERAFELSEDVDVENVKANFKNGELSVTLPKTEKKKTEVKKIAVNK
ncbi:MAG: Hsp20/alpha crystallin family protein [Victivallales bacterium]|nr:Hsp20/alpha crystallin family protein [Victivallales bacterium]MCF7889316.1 Hsp20/alpha crystallin family protein [Victivallales bacterium]